MKNKSPVVLLIAEGYNISSSWRGNALFNVLPNTFINLWQNYPHALITPSRKSSDFDDETEFSIFGSGSHVSSKKAHLMQQIENNSFINNSRQKFLLDIKKSNSALHLISSISEKNSFDILIAYLKAAKLSKCFRTYVHIFLDEKTNDSRNILSKISILNRKMEKEGLGEIASITGRSNIDDQSNIQSFKKCLKDLIYGSGSKTLTPEQCLSKKMPIDLTLDKLPTTTIYKQNKPIAQINNFDSVILVDPDIRDYSKLVLSFITPEQGILKGHTMPRMINVASAFPLFSQNFPRLHIFDEFNQKTLPTLLTKEKYSQIYIADSTRIIHLNSYLHVADSAYSKTEIIPCAEGQEYLNNISKISIQYRKAIKTALENDKYDFIMINVSFLLHANLSNQFLKSKEAIQEIDELLKDVSELVKNANGALIFTSINNQSLVENQETLYAPFIFFLDGINKSNKETNTKDFPNRVIYDLLKKKYDMIDIAPTILDLFKIGKPSSMVGNSLLSSKILTQG